MSREHAQANPMDQILLILVIAIAFGCMAWTVVAMVGRSAAPEKRKLQERLATESTFEAAATARPLLLQQQNTGLPKVLSDLPIVRRMQNWLAQGFPQMPLARFLILLAASAIITAAVAGVLSGNLPITVVGALVGAILPYFIAGSRRNKRRRLFNTQLPDALDFLSRVLRSGQSFNIGLQMMGDELPQPIAGEFRRCYDQHSLGQSIEEGLRDMAQRMDSPNFAFFTTAVIIQRQSGGDLAEVLKNLSELIRKRLRLAQTVRAKTSEGRFTGYIMVAFPAIMFAITYFIDPKRGNVMLYTSAGHVLTGVALFLQAFGLFLIKKITTVKA
jgi:tight adherence protein B